MNDLESVTSKLGVDARGVQEISQSLFERVLGKTFAELPGAVRKMHDSRISKHFEGRATITRGGGIIAKLIGAALGFPGSGENIPTTVAIRRDGDRETWVRHFGRATFKSDMSPAPTNRSGRITERFGFLSFDIDLDARRGRLHYPVARCRIGPVALPRFLTPRSDTVEYRGTEDGRFHFSVKIDLPIFGHFISYNGWLVEHANCAGGSM